MDENLEARRECAMGLCHNQVAAWKRVCEECTERYKQEQAWFAEMEEDMMMWQAEKELREAEEARSNQRKDDGNGPR